ncbi:MAG TPA: DUF3105 domain-containing protein, partial [Myxococcota bacterium]|nr:DUF3105 domain-containing protein [Myxococcota bacterium]
MKAANSREQRATWGRPFAWALIVSAAAGCGQMPVGDGGDAAEAPALGPWSATAAGPATPATPSPTAPSPPPAADPTLPDVPDAPSPMIDAQGPATDANAVAADPNALTADANSTAGGEAGAASLPPSLPIAVNPNALASFDPNTLDPTDTTQYPTCLTCYTKSFTQVPGCPAAGVGTPLPCESFCHLAYGKPTLDYSTNPPASGNHYPSPERVLGEHTAPVPRGRYVHSLEHGAIVLAYNCPQ